jgi:hypothetical protein
MISNPKIGQTYYYAYKKYALINNERITKIDENGVAWYRYEKPRVVVEVNSVIHSGHAHTIITGKIASYDFDDFADDRYYFEDASGSIDYYDLSDIFMTEKEAFDSIKI